MASEHSSVTFGEPVRATRLGELRLVEHPQAGRPPFIAAASGLALCGRFLYVQADDEAHLATFDARDPSRPGTMRSVVDADLPLDEGPRKLAKPDIESLATLPSSDAYPHGALLGVPSGSRPNRTTGFLWPLGSSGELVGAAQRVDFGPLFERLAESVAGVVNVEGSAVMGDRLVLAHRGNTAGGCDLVAGVALDRAMDGIACVGEVAPECMVSADELRLGTIDGVALTITDIASVGDRLLFTASAEETDDPVLDGPVSGSAIGWIGRDGSLESMYLLHLEGRKAEGVVVRPDASGVDRGREGGIVHVLITTDDDAITHPSAIYEAQVRMPSASPMSQPASKVRRA